MMLLDLADAVRSSGLRVVEEPNWRTRGHGQMRGVKTITCHHTAGPKTGDAPSLRVVRDGRPGLDGPLSHLVLARSGTVHVVAAGLCWHAGATWTAEQSNPWAIGIEAEATGVDTWPAVQYEAYVRLARALITHYGLPVGAVLGHKEVCSPRGRKSDPNFSMDAFRLAVTRGTPAPAARPAALPKPPVRRIRFGEDHQMHVYSPEPAKDTAKNAWPRRTVTFGFVPDTKLLHLEWGSRGGWIHQARWWVRDKDWSPNTPKHSWRDHSIGNGGSERFIGAGWLPTPPPGADCLELTFSAPDGLHIFPEPK